VATYSWQDECGRFPPRGGAQRLSETNSHWWAADDMG